MQVIGTQSTWTQLLLHRLCIIRKQNGHSNMGFRNSKSCACPLGQRSTSATSLDDTQCHGVMDSPHLGWWKWYLLNGKITHQQAPTYRIGDVWMYENTCVDLIFLFRTSLFWLYRCWPDDEVHLGTSVIFCVCVFRVSSGDEEKGMNEQANFKFYLKQMWWHEWRPGWLYEVSV